MEKKITIIGAQEHNLQNLSCVFPKNKLVVFTGVSGSGKSSLAFHTLYAEGKRRYIESLSTYARQFLGGNIKPKVTKITGLTPAIAINQKTISHNTRSTVGTTTEIFDYLRLLFARIGQAYCLNGHGPVTSLSISQMINKIYDLFKKKSKIMILAPCARDQKGSFKELFLTLQKQHFLRVFVDGEIRSLDERILLDKNQRHNIDLLVDQLEIKNNPTVQSRLYDAVEVALKYGQQLVRIVDANLLEKGVLFSAVHACAYCGFRITNLEPRLFSFNAPLGACARCKGIGSCVSADWSKIVPDPQLSIDKGAIAFFPDPKFAVQNIDWQRFQALLEHYNIPQDTPVKQLTKKQQKIIMLGSEEPITVRLYASSGSMVEKTTILEGVGTLIERRYHETFSPGRKKNYYRFLSTVKCEECAGNRLKPEVLTVKVAQLSIIEVTHLTIKQALTWFNKLSLTDFEKQIAGLIIQEIKHRLIFLLQVGLHYLTLSRPANTLSGGESQRIRLATQIGSQLTGVLYVLDEPSIGLHQKDNQKLIDTLLALRDLGNTVVVVEHDEEMIMAADWIVDLGPFAGVQGGQVIFSGTLSKFKKTIETSLTAQYLFKTKTIASKKKLRASARGVLTIKNAVLNNLQHLEVKIPLGKLIAVTGVSGSGKSSLINGVLGKNLKRYFRKEKASSSTINVVTGMHYLDRVRMVTQDPIGKTNRSTPATYTSVFDDVRELFANARESKMRGYTKARFSFNVPGGRCEPCRGCGIIEINMQFLPNVYVTCDDCHGKRYNLETLMVLFLEKNIADILAMTFLEAQTFFARQPKILAKIKIVCAIGLGYLTLGQPSTQLSGGEAQRIKLATYLLKPESGHTLFLMDEPTTGLHPWDIQKLIVIFDEIIKQGNTILIIEHNLDVIKVADYILDLGPGGGYEGGQLLAAGSPRDIAACAASYTGQYLKKIFNLEMKK